MKALAAALATLFLAVAPAAAQAEPVRLSGAEIALALTGNTVDGLWGSTPYRSYFDASGVTLYQPEGRPAERGKWRADEAQDLYCSHWERSGWSCYETTAMARPSSGRCPTAAPAIPPPCSPATSSNLKESPFK